MVLVSPEYIAEYRKAQRNVGNLVVRDLNKFWATLDLGKPDAARDALLAYVPDLTTKYGQVAATVAADWYDSVRAEAKVRGRFSATLAAPFPVKAVQERVRYGAHHLYTTPEGMLPFLTGAAQKYALQPGRDTVRQSAIADPGSAGWARVTSGNACEFCEMLAGRGAVYSEESIDFDAHDRCLCAAVPVWQ